MNTSENICLLNDSFPPLIDGVANAVENYARHICAQGGQATVITPAHPDAQDQHYPYPILRYPSVSFRKLQGYTAGFPFSPEVARALSHTNTVLLHTHCPIISTFMARQLRQIKDVPIVLTYHTKFDAELETITNNELLQKACKKALVQNISACDEVWVVSNGAGENLRAMGYEGTYTVMPNGVDLPLGKVPFHQLQKQYPFPKGIPVYLFVGRMRWYKGIRIILDGLVRLKQANRDFRMVFIGKGDDLGEILQYAEALGLMDKCLFTGGISDRDLLRAWYSRADLFLFPSSFDTNGLVVREAAACGLASILLRDSCAAEGVEDGHNGFLIEENAESLYSCLLKLDTQAMRQAGSFAARELYIPWETAVKNATEHYGAVIDRYKSGIQRPKAQPLENFFKINGELMDALGALSARRRGK